jgi:hypothetical protein
MEERRKTARRRSFLGGRLTFNNGFSIVDGVVRNLTDEGAKLDCPANLVLQDEVEIAIECKGLQGRAKVVWRSAGQLGLAFQGPLSGDERAKVVPIGTAHLIRELQAANANLRQRLAQLRDPA